MAGGYPNYCYEFWRGEERAGYMKKDKEVQREAAYIHER